MKRVITQFYKPTRGKIILAIIIIIAHIALASYGVLSNFCLENFEGYHINDCPELNTFQSALVLTAYPFVIVTVISESIPLFPISFIIGLLILIFFWYTLSCLIYLTKSKFREK